ncbi:MAG: class I SAM-dependent methyltransferase [Pseudomonadota bacterium]
MTAPLCTCCGERLAPCYRDLRDTLHATPGRWDLWHCPSGCGSARLWPPPDSQTLAAAYADYHTHRSPADAPAEANSGDRALGASARLWHRIQAARWHDRFGYRVAVTPAGRIGSALLRLWPGRLADLDAGVFFLSAPAAGTTAEPPRLLEFGCGDGALLTRMQALGWATLGTDTDPVAVTHARSRGLEVIEGGLEDVEGARRFDAIVGKHVIEHVGEPARALAHARTLLQPGGRLLLTTPNLLGSGHRRWRRDWRGLEPPRHLHLFTAEGLTRLLQDAGFEIVELRTTGRARSAARASRAQRRHSQGRPPLAGWLAALLAEAEEFGDAWFAGKLRGNELLVSARALP